MSQEKPKKDRPLTFQEFRQQREELLKNLNEEGRKQVEISTRLVATVSFVTLLGSVAVGVFASRNINTLPYIKKFANYRNTTGVAIGFLTFTIGSALVQKYHRSVINEIHQNPSLKSEILSNI